MATGYEPFERERERGRIGEREREVDMATCYEPFERERERER